MKEAIRLMMNRSYVKGFSRHTLLSYLEQRACPEGRLIVLFGVDREGG